MMRLDERKPIRKIVDGKLFCIPCNTKVESQHHFAANHDPRILKCEECGVEKIGKAKMKDHKRLHQSAKCPKCNKAYSNKSSLWTHEQLCIKGKTPQIYVCDQCSYQSTNKYRFKKHKEENLCKAMQKLEPIKIIKKEPKIIKTEVVEDKESQIRIPEKKCPFCPYETKHVRNFRRHVLETCKGREEDDQLVVSI